MIEKNKLNIIYLSGFLLFIIYIVISFLDVNSNYWVFSQFSFLSLNTKILITLILLFVFVERNNLSKLALSILSKIDYKLQKNRNKKILFLVLAGIIVFSIFLLLHTKHFLFDSLRIIEYTEQRFLKLPYITNLLFLITNNTLLSVLGLSTVWNIRIIDAFLGLAFIYFSFIISSKLFDDERKYLLFFLIIFSGTIKVFFGDIEVYSSVIILFLIFIYTSISYLRNNKSIIWPSVSFLIGYLFHAHFAVFLPSLFLLPVIKKYFDNSKKNVFVGKEIFSAMKFVIIPMFIISLFVISVQKDIFPDNKIINSAKSLDEISDNETRSFILIHPENCVNCLCKKPCGYFNETKEIGYGPGNIIPWFSSLDENTPYRYRTFFSFNHFFGKFKALFLIGPVIILMLSTLVLFFPRIISTIKKDKIFAFFSLNMMAEIGRILITNNVRNLSGDWDVILLFSPVFALWTGYYILKYLNKESKQLIFMYIILSFVIIFTWILKDAF